MTEEKKKKYSFNDMLQRKMCPECGAGGAQIIFVWRKEGKQLECSKCKKILNKEKYVKKDVKKNK